MLYRETTSSPTHQVFEWLLIPIMIRAEKLKEARAANQWCVFVYHCLTITILIPKLEEMGEDSTFLTWTCATITKLLSVVLLAPKMVLRPKCPHF